MAVQSQGLHMVRGSRWGYRTQRFFFFWLPMLIFLVVLLFPFYWMLITSFKTDTELYYDRKANPFIVNAPTLEQYLYLFQKTSFMGWLTNTVIISVASTGISLVCGVLAGYALARLRFKGASFLAIGIFVSYLVPQTLLFLPLQDVVRGFGLFDTPWALILTYPTFLIPFCTWLLMGYFKTVPHELEEAALIDGASRFKAMWKIAIPLAIPGILSAGIFAFTLSWNEFLYALIFLSSSAQKTIPVGITSELFRADAPSYGQIMAGAILGSVPVAVAYAFLVEYYVAGLSAGAVKG
jgi:multiple sugar transport system permease protein